MAGAEGLEVAPQKHSRTARLERFALLLVSSPQRHTFIRHRRRCAASPRHAPRASFSIQFAHNQNKKSRNLRLFLFWQGQKDLNPRHAVLETAALPTELYPYIYEAPKIGASWWATRDSNPGPFGYEPSALTN